MRAYAFRASGRRLFLRLGNHVLRFEGPTRWRGGPFISFRWGDAYTDGFRFGIGLGWCVFFGWAIPFSWRMFARRRLGGWPDWYRDIGIHWYGYLVLHLGYDDSDSSNNRRWQKIPLWRSRWVGGRDSYTHEILVGYIPVTVNVGQWEGDSYSGTARIERVTQKNRFRTRRRTDMWIEMDHVEGSHPLVHPGKGENSWDIDDDGYYGWGMSLDGDQTLVERCEEMAEEVRKLRRSRGGDNWRPDSMKLKVS